MIKKITHTLALALLFISCPFTVLAHDFEAVNSNGVTIYYNKISDTECEVTYLNDFEGDYAGDITIPNSVTFGGNTLTVSTIGKEAFLYCEAISSITLPNTLTSISDWAFCCCTSLSSITVPNTVSFIGEGAFYQCTNLSSVTLPNSLTSISDLLFMQCSNLASITIPDNVNTIGFCAFDECTSLYSIAIPENVTSIEDWAFWSCTSLTSVTIGNSVTSIGKDAFYGCSNLNSVSFTPYNFNSLSIDCSAFENCTSLSYIDLQNVTSIDGSAFSGCTSLTWIDVWSDISNYTSIDGVLFSKDESVLVRYPSGKQGEYTIPNTVTTIGEYAFEGCTALSSIDFPNTLTSIEPYAFRGCTALSSIDFPNTLTSIEYCAFEGCSSLTSVKLPNSINYIGSDSFKNCGSLKSVNILANTPPRYHGYIFDNRTHTSATLYVPAGAKAAYAAADAWKYFSKIVELEIQPGDANLDGTVDVADIIAIRNLILNK